MKNLFLLLSVIGLIVYGQLPAQSASSVESLDKENQKRCEAFENLEPPERDIPTPAQEATLSHCDAEADYYGIGRPKNYVRARHCAFAQMDNGQDDTVFGGAGILMDLYANGLGVRRNFDLARKYACEVGGATAELQGRLSTLAQYKKTNWRGHNYDICTDVTSGTMSGFCTDQQTRIAEVKRQEKIKTISQHWSLADKKAYSTLKKAMRQFIDARTGYEVDLSGTARGSFASEEDNHLSQDAYQLLIQLQKNQLPNTLGKQYTVADLKLNELYEKAMRFYKENADVHGTITARGIHETELKWLACRDAWIRFAQQVYPNVSTMALKTRLTQTRSKMLAELLQDG